MPVLAPRSTLTLVGRVFVQRMKTKWGSCNPSARTIRLNTDLAKKPRECLEYIVVHELVSSPTDFDRLRRTQAASRSGGVASGEEAGTG